ncbi:O-antigen ligase family protein [Maribacter dokdonensis]|uniref:O-antigen ligase family protein n=1 Tax=Maribacter dokdonensis TaxID=320912 RepID=UPI0007198D97|nr:O-antigen ligase family protein [Maribacter dokdonensis]KSA14305.1 Polysaccharide polymerase [Maribacter dokdonensis DSW-8]
MEFLKRVNNYALYLLIFSITFEKWDPLNTAGSLSVAFIVSIIYISSWIPFLKTNLNLFIFRKYTSLLVLFIITGLLSTSLRPEHLIDISQAYNFRVLLLIFLMLLITNHLYNKPELIKIAFNTYLLSIIVMFVLFTLGIGVTFFQGRVLIFKENPNIIGIKAIMALIVVLGRLFSGPFSTKKLFNPFNLVIPASITLILASGSRGAFLSIFIGFILILAFKKMTPLKKISIFVIGIFLSGLLYNLVLQSNELLQKRLENSLESGDIGRNELWEGAFEIFQKHPIIGVGFTGIFPEMYKHTGHFLYPHNIFLYVLVTTGVIGFLFYILFIYRVFLGLYNSYKETRNVTYLILFFMIVINLMKVGGGINMMLFWFFFALLLSSALVVNNPVSKNNSIKVH